MAANLGDGVGVVALDARHYAMLDRAGEVAAVLNRVARDARLLNAEPAVADVTMSVKCRRRDDGAVERCGEFSARSIARARRAAEFWDERCTHRS